MRPGRSLHRPREDNTGSGVASVAVGISDGQHYWDGAAFASLTPVFNPAVVTGTTSEGTSWSFAMAASNLRSGAGYTVQSQVTAVNGTVEAPVYGGGFYYTFSAMPSVLSVVNSAVNDNGVAGGAGGRGEGGGVANPWGSVGGSGGGGGDGGDASGGAIWVGAGKLISSGSTMTGNGVIGGDGSDGGEGGDASDSPGATGGAAGGGGNGGSGFGGAIWLGASVTSQFSGGSVGAPRTAVMPVPAATAAPAPVLAAPLEERAAMAATAAMPSAPLCSSLRVTASTPLTLERPPRSTAQILNLPLGTFN